MGGWPRGSLGQLVPVVVLGLTLLTLRVDGVYPDVQGFDIFSGEHLDDTILPTGGDRSFVHAVLVIYQSECAGLLKKYRIEPDLLPMTKYVHLLMHDYQISNTRTWYDYNGDDLRKRYRANSCLDVIFIPKGSRSNSAAVTDKWDMEGLETFSDWVWGHMVVAVEITNNLASTVSMTSIQTGHAIGSMEYPSFTILPHRTKTVGLYESSLIRITQQVLDPRTRNIDDKLVGVWIVNGSSIVDIVQDVPVRQFDEVFKEIQEFSKQEDFETLETAWNAMQRHLLNLKQPLIVPQFTKTGYKKIQVPEKWFSVLRSFYNENTKARKDEPWTFGESIINQNEVSFTLPNLH